MADKLIVVIVNANPADPDELVPPLSQATVAAAMEYEVEIILSGRGAELARRGVAESLLVNGEEGKTLYGMIQEARQAGVSFKACTPTPADLLDEDLIPEIDETVGGAYLISEAMDDATVTFTY